MDKKRILYVGGFSLPDKNAAAHRVLGIAKCLRELGYDVVFLDVSDEFTSSGISEKHSVCGFDCHTQKHAKGTREWLQYASKPLNVADVLGLYDNWHAVIAYNYPALALNSLLKLCRSKDIKLISDCTEWYQADKRLSLHGLFVKTDSFLRMRVVQKKLDGIIAISSYLYDFYKDSVPTVRIPPLVDTTDEKWQPLPDMSASERLSLVYAGSTSALKDRLDSVIRAIGRSTRPVTFNIVGLTEEECISLYPDLTQKITEMASSGILVFHGRLSHNDALGEIKRNDFSVFFRYPNKVTKAGFPTKFVESITCSTPVISNPMSDIADYMVDGNNGVILSTDSFENDLAEWLSDKILPKPQVDSTVFDYRKYTDKAAAFLDAVERSHKQCRKRATR